MAGRVLLFAAWASVGGVLTYGTLQLLGLFGLALVIAVVVAGLPIRAIHSGAHTEMVGLAAGPGILFAIIGESDDAPGLVLIGGAILAATAIVYLSLRRRGSPSAA
jgi:hypothetical protein